MFYPPFDWGLLMSWVTHLPLPYPLSPQANLKHRLSWKVVWIMLTSSKPIANKHSTPPVTGSSFDWNMLLPIRIDLYFWFSGWLIMLFANLRIIWDVSMKTLLSLVCSSLKQLQVRPILTLLGSGIWKRAYHQLSSATRLKFKSTVFLMLHGPWRGRDCRAIAPHFFPH